MENAIYRFIDEHKEMELTRYGDILEKSDIKWDAQSMKHADVSALDGRTVMALLVGAVRAERFVMEHCWLFVRTAALPNGSKD